MCSKSLYRLVLSAHTQHKQQTVQGMTVPAAAVLPLPCFPTPCSHTFRAIICLIHILLL